MQHHSEIFNVTPPNAKAEDKMKTNMVRYPLKPVETQQMRWKGFRTKRTDTVLDHITKSDRTMKSSNEPSSQRTQPIDPFSQDWVFANEESKVNDFNSAK